MPIPIQPLDQNYKPLANDLYDPIGKQFVAATASTVLTSSDGTPYASEKVTLDVYNSGLPVNVPTILQKAKNASTGSVATLAQAFTNANVAGNTIVVVCGCGNGTAMTVADSLGNTYTSAVSKANSTTFETAIFFTTNILPGINTVTVTNAGTAASIALQIYEVSGLLAQVNAQPDIATSGTGTSATPTLSALAPTASNTLAFLGISVGTAAQATSVTAATNWTLDSTQNTTTPAGLYSFGALSQFRESIDPFIPTATIAGSEPYSAVAAIFKPVSLGITGTVTIGGYNYTHITTGTTLVKTGVGILHAIAVNKPVATTIEADDALTNTTPIIAIMTPGTATAMAPFTMIYDALFTTGLSVTVGATIDITVIWK